MKKKSFIKRIKEKISNFFEEEDNESENEEINLKTLIIIFLIGFIIIVSIYVYTNKGFEFMNPGLDETEGIMNPGLDETEGIMNPGLDETEGTEQDDENREIIQFEDYFLKKGGLENSDFSEGINHWCTSKGNKFNDDSPSNMTLNKEDYHSAPQSLQMTCLEHSCRIYYNKKSNSLIIDSPYEFNNETWVGIKPKTKLEIGYWYKGCEHRISFLTLDKYGNFDNSKEVVSKYSEIWTRKDITFAIPLEARAFEIEIMIGQGGYLLLDDIQLEKIE